MKRSCGVLLPIFSLPSKYGIGSFSKEAFEFIDFLKEAGQSCWQILPLGPTGYGDSPYQSFSTFAGNPYFIDLKTLVKEGLLTKKECKKYHFGDDPQCIDYEKLYQSRFLALKTAFGRFERTEDYERFVDENRFWLADYSLYMAIKDKNEGASWTRWEEPLRNREEAALERAREELAGEIQFYQFQQYQFFRQWNRLHSYARKKGIQIIGDIPIYVAFDSADTWASPELFQFDENHKPVAVAGCPPDAFSPTGQLWGNPLYDWDYHRTTGFDWWVKRVSYSLSMYDIVRIDHFRGFDEYYSIPYGNETAEEGSWLPGPGMELFRTLEHAIGRPEIIAEDLGFLTPTVRKLLKDSGFPGMKVIQFAFDSRESSDYLPHTYTRECVVYTGTHDNDTTRGWYHTAGEKTRRFAKEYMCKPRLDEDSLTQDFIALALSSVADLCIIPLADYLGLDTEARINTPSTLGGNWVWRLEKGQIGKKVSSMMYKAAKLYGRLPEEKVSQK